MENPLPVPFTAAPALPFPDTAPALPFKDAAPALPFPAPGPTALPAFALQAEPTEAQPLFAQPLSAQPLFTFEAAHYGVVSAPQDSPAPSTRLLGVEALSSGGVKARQNANRAALDALETPTPDLDVLARYSGGGSLGESVNEYYTPTAVAEIMYAAAGLTPEVGARPAKPGKKNEPQALRVLDLACGIGSLLSRAPCGAQVIGVELETTSARIAQQLLPHASIHNMSAERYLTQSTDPFFDLSIINPPYGPRTALGDDRESKVLKTNEEYFVLKALGRVKYATGLVVALVNISMTHSSRTDEWRSLMDQHGEIIHSVVVPKQAFEKAGAGVTTVILTIRRFDLGVQEALRTLTGVQRRGVMRELTASQPNAQGEAATFASGELIYRAIPNATDPYVLTDTDESRWLGQSPALSQNFQGSLMYDSPLDCSAEKTEKIRRAVNKALRCPAPTLRQVIGQIHALYGEDVSRDAMRASRTALSTPLAIGSTNPEKTWVVTPDGWKPNDDLANPIIANALTIAHALSQLPSADPVQRVHQYAHLSSMNAAYLQAHGAYPQEQLKRLSARIPVLALLCASLSGGTLDLTDHHPEPLVLSGTLEEIAQRLGDLMLLTEERLMHHSRCTAEEAAQLLETQYCWNGQVWVSNKVYYAGNAVLKAKECRLLAAGTEGLRRDALLNQAAEWLSRVKKISIEDIDLSPRDPVIPTAALQVWVNLFLGTVHEDKHLITLERHQGSLKFFISALHRPHGGLDLRGQISSQEVRALCAYLNFRTEVDEVEGAGKMEAKERNEKRAVKIEEAREYEQRVRAHFQTWLKSSPVLESVMDSYTQARGAFLRPEGLGELLNLARWKGLPEHPYQSSDVRLAAATNGIIFGYGVGVGKTLAALLLVALLKQLGQANQPVIVVPAKLIAHWQKHASQSMPHWKIMTVGMSPVLGPHGQPRYKTCKDGTPMLDEQGKPVAAWKEDSTAVRQTKLAQIAAGQMDLIIMGRETFTSLPLSEATTLEMIQNDPQLQAQRESEQADTGNKRRSFDDMTHELKCIQRVQSRLRGKLGTDISFERFGYDLLIFDECHAYKNVYSAPKVHNQTPRFLGAGMESNRALDAVFKGRYVRAAGGKTYGLSASWVKNSPLEIHGMMSLICDDLPMFGLATNQSLMEQYLDIQPRILTDMSGEVRTMPAVVGFNRLIELKSIRDAKIIVRNAGDDEVVTRNGQKLHIPNVVVKESLFDFSPEQAIQYDEYRKQAREATSKSTGDDHLFSCMWRMRKLTADPALVGVAGENPRFEAFATEALRIRAKGLKSVGFLSIGETKGSFVRLKETLVSRGYPADEIEIVSGKTHQSAVQCQDLEDRFNYGDLTLVIGSEVLAEGFNLQIGSGAIIHGDVLWNYQGINQRNGRVGRQGNALAEVECIYLLQRGSFDTVTYGNMRGKKAWEDQINGTVDWAENSGAALSTEELAIMMSDSPEALRANIEQQKQRIAQNSETQRIRRRTDALYSAVLAKDEWRGAVLLASSRPNGWTAHDYLRVASAEHTFNRARQAVDDPASFALASIIDYEGEVIWYGGVPIHAGMTFQYDKQPLRIETISPNEQQIEARDQASGERKILTLREVAYGGSEWTPNPDPALYVREVHQAQGFEVDLHWKCQIRVYSGPATQPIRTTEPPLSVSLLGSTVEVLHNLAPDELNNRFTRGETVIHFLMVPGRGKLVIEHLVILAPNAEAAQVLNQLTHQDGFRKNLVNVARQALGN